MTITDFFKDIFQFILFILALVLAVAGIGSFLRWLF